MKIIDISVPVSPHLPVWPGEAPPRIRQTASMKNGDPCNVSFLEIGSHTGTHIDAPLHFVDDAGTTNEIPLEKLIGPCVVVDMRGKSRITADDLEALALPEATEKILFKTDNS